MRPQGYEPRELARLLHSAFLYILYNYSISELFGQPFLSF